MDDILSLDFNMPFYGKENDNHHLVGIRECGQQLGGCNL
jgi:hypothetical protein